MEGPSTGPHLNEVGVPRSSRRYRSLQARTIGTLRSFDADTQNVVNFGQISEGAQVNVNFVYGERPSERRSFLDRVLRRKHGQNKEREEAAGARIKENEEDVKSRKSQKQAKKQAKNTKATKKGFFKRVASVFKRKKSARYGETKEDLDSPALYDKGLNPDDNAALNDSVSWMIPDQPELTDITTSSDWSLTPDRPEVIETPSMSDSSMVSDSPDTIETPSPREYELVPDMPEFDRPAASDRSMVHDLLEMDTPAVWGAPDNPDGQEIREPNALLPRNQSARLGDLYLPANLGRMERRHGEIVQVIPVNDRPAYISGTITFGSNKLEKVLSMMRLGGHMPRKPNNPNFCQYFRPFRDFRFIVTENPGDVNYRDVCRVGETHLLPSPPAASIPRRRRPIPVTKRQAVQPHTASMESELTIPRLRLLENRTPGQTRSIPVQSTAERREFLGEKKNQVGEVLVSKHFMEYEGKSKLTDEMIHEAIAQEIERRQQLESKERKAQINTATTIKKKKRSDPKMYLRQSDEETDREQETPERRESDELEINFEVEKNGKTKLTKKELKELDKKQKQEQKEKAKLDKKEKMERKEREKREMKEKKEKEKRVKKEQKEREEMEKKEKKELEKRQKLEQKKSKVENSKEGKHGKEETKAEELEEKKSKLGEKEKEVHKETEKEESEQDETKKGTVEKNEKDDQARKEKQKDDQDTKQKLEEVEKEIQVLKSKESKEKLEQTEKENREKKEKEELAKQEKIEQKEREDIEKKLKLEKVEKELEEMKKKTEKKRKEELEQREKENRENQELAKKEKQEKKEKEELEKKQKLEQKEKEKLEKLQKKEQEKLAKKKMEEQAKQEKIAKKEREEIEKKLKLKQKEKEQLEKLEQKEKENAEKKVKEELAKKEKLKQKEKEDMDRELKQKQAEKEKLEKQEKEEIKRKEELDRKQKEEQEKKDKEEEEKKQKEKEEKEKEERLKRMKKEILEKMELEEHKKKEKKDKKEQGNLEDELEIEEKSPEKENEESEAKKQLEEIEKELQEMKKEGELKRKKELEEQEKKNQEEKEKEELAKKEKLEQKEKEDLENKLTLEKVEEEILEMKKKGEQKLKNEQEQREKEIQENKKLEKKRKLEQEKKDEEERKLKLEQMEKEKLEKIEQKEREKREKKEKEEAAKKEKLEQKEREETEKKLKQKQKEKEQLEKMEQIEKEKREKQEKEEIARQEKIEQKQKENEERKLKLKQLEKEKLEQKEKEEIKRKELEKEKLEQKEEEDMKQKEENERKEKEKQEKKEREEQERKNKQEQKEKAEAEKKLKQKHKEQEKLEKKEKEEQIKREKKEQKEKEKQEKKESKEQAKKLKKEMKEKEKLEKLAKAEQKEKEKQERKQNQDKRKGMMGEKTDAKVHQKRARDGKLGGRHVQSYARYVVNCIKKTEKEKRPKRPDETQPGECSSLKADELQNGASTEFPKKPRKIPHKVMYDQYRQTINEEDQKSAVAEGGIDEYEGKYKKFSFYEAFTQDVSETLKFLIDDADNIPQCYVEAYCGASNMLDTVLEENASTLSNEITRENPYLSFVMMQAESQGDELTPETYDEITNDMMELLEGVIEDDMKNDELPSPYVEAFIYIVEIFDAALDKSEESDESESEEEQLVMPKLDFSNYKSKRVHREDSDENLLYSASEMNDPTQPPIPNVVRPTLKEKIPPLEHHALSNGLTSVSGGDEVMEEDDRHVQESGRKEKNMTDESPGSERQSVPDNKESKEQKPTDLGSAEEEEGNDSGVSLERPWAKFKDEERPRPKVSVPPLDLSFMDSDSETEEMQLAYNMEPMMKHNGGVKNLEETLCSKEHQKPVKKQCSKKQPVPKGQTRPVKAKKQTEKGSLSKHVDSWDSDDSSEFGETKGTLPFSAYDGKPQPVPTDDNKLFGKGSIKKAEERTEKHLDSWDSDDSFEPEETMGTLPFHGFKGKSNLEKSDDPKQFGSKGSIKEAEERTAEKDLDSWDSDDSFEPEETKGTLPFHGFKGKSKPEKSDDPKQFGGNGSIKEAEERTAEKDLDSWDSDDSFEPEEQKGESKPVKSEDPIQFDDNAGIVEAEERCSEPKDEIINQAMQNNDDFIAALERIAENDQTQTADEKNESWRVLEDALFGEEQTIPTKESGTKEQLVLPKHPEKSATPAKDSRPKEQSVMPVNPERSATPDDNKAAVQNDTDSFIAALEKVAQNDQSLTEIEKEESWRDLEMAVFGQEQVLPAKQEQKPVQSQLSNKQPVQNAPKVPDSAGKVPDSAGKFKSVTSDVVDSLKLNSVKDKFEAALERSAAEPTDQMKTQTAAERAGSCKTSLETQVPYVQSVPKKELKTDGAKDSFQAAVDRSNNKLSGEAEIQTSQSATSTETIEPCRGNVKSAAEQGPHNHPFSPVLGIPNGRRKLPPIRGFPGSRPKLPPVGYSVKQGREEPSTALNKITDQLETKAEANFHVESQGHYVVNCDVPLPKAAAADASLLSVKPRTKTNSNEATNLTYHHEEVDRITDEPEKDSIKATAPVSFLAFLEEEVRDMDEGSDGMVQQGSYYGAGSKTLCSTILEEEEEEEGEYGSPSPIFKQQALPPRIPGPEDFSSDESSDDRLGVQVEYVPTSPDESDDEVKDNYQSRMPPVEDQPVNKYKAAYEAAVERELDANEQRLESLQETLDSLAKELENPKGPVSEIQKEMFLVYDEMEKLIEKQEERIESKTRENDFKIWEAQTEKEKNQRIEDDFGQIGSGLVYESSDEEEIMGMWENEKMIEAVAHTNAQQNGVPQQSIEDTTAQGAIPKRKPPKVKSKNQNSTADASPDTRQQPHKSYPPTLQQPHPELSVEQLREMKLNEVQNMKFPACFPEELIRQRKDVAFFQSAYNTEWAESVLHHELHPLQAVLLDLNERLDLTDLPEMDHKEFSTPDAVLQWIKTLDPHKMMAIAGDPRLLFSGQLSPYRSAEDMHFEEKIMRENEKYGLTNDMPLNVREARMKLADLEAVENMEFPMCFPEELVQQRKDVALFQSEYNREWAESVLRNRIHPMQAILLDINPRLHITNFPPMDPLEYPTPEAILDLVQKLDPEKMLIIAKDPRLLFSGQIDPYRSVDDLYFEDRIIAENEKYGLSTDMPLDLRESRMKQAEFHKIYDKTWHLKMFGGSYHPLRAACLKFNKDLADPLKYFNFPLKMRADRFRSVFPSVEVFYDFLQMLNPDGVLTLAKNPDLYNDHQFMKQLFRSQIDLGFEKFMAAKATGDEDVLRQAFLSIFGLERADDWSDTKECADKLSEPKVPNGMNVDVVCPTRNGRTEMKPKPSGPKKLPPGGRLAIKKPEGSLPDLPKPGSMLSMQQAPSYEFRANDEQTDVSRSKSRRSHGSAAQGRQAYDNRRQGSQASMQRERHYASGHSRGTQPVHHQGPPMQRRQSREEQPTSKPVSSNLTPPMEERPQMPPRRPTRLAPLEAHLQAALPKPQRLTPIKPIGESTQSSISIPPFAKPALGSIRSPSQGKSANIQQARPDSLTTTEQIEEPSAQIPPIKMQPWMGTPSALVSKNKPQTPQSGPESFTPTELIEETSAQLPIKTQPLMNRAPGPLGNPRGLAPPNHPLGSASEKPRGPRNLHPLEQLTPQPLQRSGQKPPTMGRRATRATTASDHQLSQPPHESPFPEPKSLHRADGCSLTGKAPLPGIGSRTNPQGDRSIEPPRQISGASDPPLDDLFGTMPGASRRKPVAGRRQEPLIQISGASASSPAVGGSRNPPRRSQEPLVGLSGTSRLGPPEEGPRDPFGPPRQSTGAGFLGKLPLGPIKRRGNEP